MRVYLMIPLFVVAITLLITIVRNIGRMWLDHRVRLALLEKLEKKPELLRSFEELQDVIDGESGPDTHQLQDFTWTGAILVVIGIVCVIVNAVAGTGSWAVGAYFGGVGCVVVGFLLTMLGLLIRFLSRTPANRD